MKKNGFTLAEVLITMAIIGVIAAVTLPALNVNVNENSSATRYKKAISTLNSIGTIVMANDRFGFSDVVPGQVADGNRGNANGQLRRQLYAVLDRYGKLDRRLTGQAIGGACAGRNTIFFKDGSAFCYTTGNAAVEEIHGFIDVNGRKEPNRASTCQDANCTNRSIQDQFPITLAGDEAFPGNCVLVNGVPTYRGGDAEGQDWAAMWATDSLIGGGNQAAGGGAGGIGVQRPVQGNEFVPFEPNNRD